MPSSSPFDSDEDPDAVEASSDPVIARRRQLARTRRRALVGGMLVLLALVWIRELLGLSDGPVWLVSFVVLGYMLIVCLRANEATHRYLVDLRDKWGRDRRREQLLREAVARIEAERLKDWKASDHRCPECQGEMSPIRLADGVAGHPLRYVGLNVPSWVGADEPVLGGEVYGEVCRECARIVLRGLPY